MHIFKPHETRNKPSAESTLKIMGFNKSYVTRCISYRATPQVETESLPAKHRTKPRKKQSFFHGKVKALIAIVVIVIILAAGYQVIGAGKMTNTNNNTNPTKILLITSMGNITIQLYDDMPITSGNFKSLTQRGVYDGTIFHRVVANFVIQGGDATPKGITVPTIRDELPNKHSNVRGSVAMAKTEQPNSATSQFYINLNDSNTYLDSNYSVFGTVTAGMNVVDAIGNTPTDANQKPLQTITIIKAQIIT